jgi:uncharacterized protein involved in exopolysaccharide biosynthesis
LAKAHNEKMEEIRREAAEELNRRLEEAGASNQSAVDPQVIEAQVRERMENETMERMREHETQFEEKLKKIKEE